MGCREAGAWDWGMGGYMMAEGEIKMGGYMMVEGGIKMGQGLGQGLGWG